MTRFSRIKVAAALNKRKWNSILRKMRSFSILMGEWLFEMALISQITVSYVDQNALQSQK